MKRVGIVTQGIMGRMRLNRSVVVLLAEGDVLLASPELKCRVERRRLDVAPLEI